MKNRDSYSTANIRQFRRASIIMSLFPVLVIGLTLLTFYTSYRKQPESLAQQPTTSEVSPEVVVTGLDTVWSMRFAPDGKLYFSERRGVIKVYTNGQVQTVATLTQSVEGSEEGLQGIELHPNFAANGWLYAYYTYNSGGLKNRLVRFTINPSSATVTGGPTTLIDGIPGYRFHNGGRIKFGPDGKLYVATGAATPDTSSQDKSSLSGKILRVNDDGSGVSDNPFSENRRVYSMGHRNPQGLAWHPVTKEMWSTEHGPSSSAPYCCNDEVNKIVKGGNYGWPRYYGMNGQDGNYSYFNISHIKPVWTSGTSSKWAPGGAMFYSGSGPLGSPWTNSLIFTGLGGIDKSNQALFRIRLGSDNRTPAQIDRLYHNTYGRLRDVVQGPDGAIYMSTSNMDGRGSSSYGSDRIIRLKPVGLPNPTPPPAPAPSPPPPNPTPSPSPSPPPSPPPSETPPVIVPGSGTEQPVTIPTELPTEQDGTIIADFTGDGVNEVVRDVNKDGRIDPKTELVTASDGTPGVAALSDGYTPLNEEVIDADSTVTIKPGPFPEVKIAKPVAYTFLTAGGITLAGVGSYLAVAKLAVFASLRSRWGL